jgi:broad specificity phosphatase PhoE
VSSPRLRATATAAAIVAAVGRPAGTVDIDRRWAEADFGSVEGRSFAELEASFPDLAARLALGDTEIDWPDGETAAALAARVAVAWLDVIAADRPVVVVSHAGPIRIALALAARVSPEAVRLPAPGELRRVVVS